MLNFKLGLIPQIAKLSMQAAIQKNATGMSQQFANNTIGQMLCGSGTNPFDIEAFGQ